MNTNKLSLRLFLMGMVLTVMLAFSQVANATYYQVSGSGTWSSLASTLSQQWSNSGAWNFSFDLSNPLTGNPSPGSNFQFNGYSSTPTFINNNNFPQTNSLINTSGKALVPVNGTLKEFSYTGGIAFDPGSLSSLYTLAGSPVTSWGNGISLSSGMFSMITCLNSCNPNNQSNSGDGPDGLLITGTDVLSGTSLSLGTYSVGLSLDAGSGLGTGTVNISTFAGSIPGSTNGGGVSATPEPPTVWLMATGILGMFGWAGYRRIKAQA